MGLEAWDVGGDILGDFLRYWRGFIEELRYVLYHGCWGGICSSRVIAMVVGG